MNHPLIRYVIALAILCSNACTTASPAVNDDVPSEPSEPEMPVVPVVPEEGCPDVEPDLTTVVGAEIDRRGLHISVRTTTFCNEHEFTVHTCDETEGSTTYRVSETNDCELPNDGVLEHVLFIEREHLGEADQVAEFESETVTVRR